MITRYRRPIRSSRLWATLFIHVMMFILVSTPGMVAAQSAQTKENSSDGLFSANFQNAPTYIKSKTMTLFSEQRRVEYKESVEVLHEDMKLTCDRLEALYTVDNAIDKIFAYDNVFITRENGTQARSEKAIYDKATEIVTLTINPEVQENGSVVTADTIRIFLTEDRSEAEGDVRVKLVKQENKEKDETNKKKENKSGLGSILR